MAHAGGRPTKYKEEFCDKIPELMKHGMAKVEVCAELGFGYDAFLDWQKKYSEFSEAVKKGDKLSEAWWVKQGRIALREKEFNATLWYMNMKNRHGWSDKQEVTVGGDLGLNINEMTEERKKELKEIALLRAELALKDRRNASDTA